MAVLLENDIFTFWSWILVIGRYAIMFRFGTRLLVLTVVPSSCTHHTYLYVLHVTAAVHRPRHRAITYTVSILRVYFTEVEMAVWLCSSSLGRRLKFLCSVPHLQKTGKFLGVGVVLPGAQK